MCHRRWARFSVKRVWLQVVVTERHERWRLCELILVSSHLAHELKCERRVQIIWKSEISNFSLFVKFSAIFFFRNVIEVFRVIGADSNNFCSIGLLLFWVPSFPPSEHQLKLRIDKLSTYDKSVTCLTLCWSDWRFWVRGISIRTLLYSFLNRSQFFGHNPKKPCAVSKWGLCKEFCLSTDAEGSRFVKN